MSYHSVNFKLCRKHRTVIGDLMHIYMYIICKPLGFFVYPNMLFKILCKSFFCSSFKIWEVNTYLVDNHKQVQHRPNVNTYTLPWIWRICRIRNQKLVLQKIGMIFSSWTFYFHFDMNFSQMKTISNSSYDLIKNTNPKGFCMHAK